MTVTALSDVMPPDAMWPETVRSGAMPPGEGPLESPWPRPVLRLVEEISPAPPTWELAEEDLPVRTGVEASVRRQGRTSRRVRRRRVAAAVLVAGLLVVLALPVSALAGRPAAAGHPAAVPAGSPGHQVTYVVQPGDTLWSIASRLDRGGDPRPLASELASQIGSAVVYPGERIVLP